MASDHEKNLLLINARTSRGWRQQDVADKVGTTPLNINRWEQGKTKPGPYYRAALVKAFGMSEQQLGLTLLDTSPLNQPSTDFHQTDHPSVEQLPFPSEIPQSVPSAQKRPRRKREILVFLAIVLVVALLGGGLTYWHFQFDAPSPMVGHLSFLSSGQISDTSNQGITDELQVELSLRGSPKTGYNYSVWLLPDENQTENTVFLLGKLVVSGSTGKLSYTNPQHTNLLAITSRLLITEENATTTPLAPSVDKKDWRYIGKIPNQPATGESYGFLDHLRHLLTQDPKLATHSLPGGLTPWLYRNTQAVYAQVLKARDEQTAGIVSTAVVRQEVISILSGLDGASFVSQDLPTTLPPFTPTDARFSSIGLLQLQANQDPPGYLYHVSIHLTGLSSSPGATSTLQQQVTKLIATMNGVNAWMEQIRQDAKQLVVMRDEQLMQQQASNLFNDMVTNANYALVGKTETATGNTQEGVQWIMQTIETLATMEITQYSA